MPGLKTAESKILQFMTAIQNFCTKVLIEVT